MRGSFILLVLLVTIKAVQAQYLLTQPNKYVNNLKEGWWSELNYSQLIDSNGKYHSERDLHGTPKNVVAEGIYKKGEREGFWKEYWINTLYDSFPRFVRGGLKSIIEYKGGTPCGLVIEYYKNGFIKAVGMYETFRVNEIRKFQVPDWTDPKLQTLKDTVVYIKTRNRPIGVWQFFNPDGTIWNRIVYD